MWCPTFTFTLILICYRWLAWGLWNCKRQSQSISRLILLIWNAWLPTFQPSPHLSAQGFETSTPLFFPREILTAPIFDSQGKETIFDDKSHAFMFFKFHLLDTLKCFQYGNFKFSLLIDSQTGSQIPVVDFGSSSRSQKWPLVEVCWASVKSFVVTNPSEEND